MGFFVFEVVLTSAVVQLGLALPMVVYFHRIGFGPEADRVRQAYQARERDKAAQLVTDAMVDAVTIIGNPQQCRDQMQAFFDAGVQEIRLVFNEPNKEAYLQALKAVAPRG